MTAREAADLLGVAPATLYAYVSRGLLPAQRASDGRRSLYPRSAVMALKARSSAPRGPAEAARGTLDFDRPVAESAITLIDAGRLWYRGRDAAGLADTHSLEDVAALLWQVPWQAGRQSLPPRLAASLPFMSRAQVALAIMGGGDARAFDISPAQVAATGARIVGVLAALAAGAEPEGNELVHQRLARAWRLDAAGTDLVRAVLVLLADHEFNASTFAVRIVASTGAAPYAAVQAGLAALSGPRHGGATLRVEALLDEISDRDPAAMIAARLRRGDGLPGFGHRLYPEGDPRATVLLERLARLQSPAGQRLLAIADQGRALGGQPPSVDFASVAVARALGLPDGAALQLFTIARAAGWIAHAMEQYASGALLRPRAVYTGPRP